MIFICINNSETLRALVGLLATLSLVRQRIELYNIVTTNHMWPLKIKLTEVK